MCALEWHWWGLLHGPCCSSWAVPRALGSRSNGKAEPSEQKRPLIVLRHRLPFTHILGKTNPLFSYNRTSAFPLYVHSKSHSSLTPWCNSWIMGPTQQVGRQDFCLHSQPSCHCPWGQSLFVCFLWVCEKNTLSTHSLAMKDRDMVWKCTNCSKQGVWDSVITPIHKGDKF